jgi:xylulose-5-phosphate/fructose-6-phosphate phosphoketolase
MPETTMMLPSALAYDCVRLAKGWTGPKEVDGLRNEGTFRSHQIPLLIDAEHPHHVKLLENWMKSYKPEELFDANGSLMPELAELGPKGERRMGANPHANGGLLLHDLNMPDFTQYAVDVPSPGSVQASDTHVLGEFLRDVINTMTIKKTSAFSVPTKYFRTD